MVLPVQNFAENSKVNLIDSPGHVDFTSEVWSIVVKMLRSSCRWMRFMVVLISFGMNKFWFNLHDFNDAVVFGFGPILYKLMTHVISHMNHPGQLEGLHRGTLGRWCLGSGRLRGRR